MWFMKNQGWLPACVRIPVGIRIALVCIAYSITCIGSPGAAVIFDYDCADTPDAPQYDFTTGSCGIGEWYAEASELHMITSQDVPGHDGIAFGNYPPNLPTWTIPPDSVGTHLSIRMRQVAGSRDWYFYINDASCSVYLKLLDDNTVVCRHAAGWDSFVVETTIYHEYSALLRMGTANYWIDGRPVCSAPAAVSDNTNLVIGDGSCTSLHTTGELIVDHVALHTGDGPFITNIRARQEPGLSLVLAVTYDLTHAGDLPCIVTLQASNDDGTSWDIIPITTVSGAVGEGVIPGRDLVIRWNAGVDWPGQMAESLLVRIIADK